MIKSKGCRRCGGDLILEKDADGITATCLQCSASYFQRLEPVSQLKTGSQKMLTGKA